MQLNHADWLRVAAAFERAVANHPEEYVEACYCLGGRRVRLRCVGRQLAEHYHRSFAHLAAGCAEPVDLTLDLWDEAVSGVPLPLGSILRGEGAARDAEGDRIVHDEAGRLYCTAQPGAVTLLDRRARRIVGWRANGSRLALHERAKPLPFLLSIWLYDCDVHVLHAACVSKHGAGVLIGGGSGIGKTTTALTALLAGYDLLGDDQVGLEQLEGGTYAAHSLYGSVRVAPDHLVRFPKLAPLAIAGNPTTCEKSLLFFQEIAPAQAARTTTIRALAIPRRAAGSSSSIRRTGKVEALVNLAPTSLFTPLGAGRRRFERLTGLLAEVPIYWLELGSDLGGIAQQVDLILREAHS